MWVQHPAFGAPLIGRGARLATSARRVSADPELCDDTLAGHGSWAWPHACDAGGAPVDLSVLPECDEPRALLAYLEEFDDHSVTISNAFLATEVTLRWCGETWPAAWLWQEVHGTAGSPWFGRAHTVAIEPASTVPAWGAARAVAHGGQLVHVPAGGSRTAWIELEVKHISDKEAT
jgi:hypothetical protein